jgi:hypothetical protein
VNKNLKQLMQIIISITGIAQENELRVNISSCLCPGCELVLECTITGDGAVTIWQGTIFNGCLNEKITLRHSGFVSGIEIQESCGARGPVVARSALAANGSFTSQLLVNISEDLLGRTIECANESGQIVGSKQIGIPPGKKLYACMHTYYNTQSFYILLLILLSKFNCTLIVMQVDCLCIIEGIPPPTITLSEINTDQLTFTWSSITTVTNLSGVQYFVNASNCGVCPNTTYSNSVRCNFINITSNLHVCSLTIITVVCGRIGSASDPFIVTIQGQLNFILRFVILTL